MNTINIEQFINDYLETAIWAECDSDECTDFTRKAKKEAKETCLDFIQRVINVFGKEDGNKLLTVAGNDLTYLAPHDFYLTRNGHGSGFWDKEDIYGEENSLKLTMICEAMGTKSAYHKAGKKSKLIFE